MELILYYIKISAGLLISFLVLIFILGTFAYLSMRNFKQTSKFKVAFYGLFLGFKNIDIIRLSAVVIRTFIICYATAIVTQERIFICISMVGILSLIYIFLTPKKFVYSLVSSLMQMVMIYFIYIIGDYMNEIEFSYPMLGIKITLIVFTLILSIYLFLRDLNDIVEARWNKDFEKSRKNLKVEKNNIFMQSEKKGIK